MNLEILNNFQNNGRFHPLTCLNDGDDMHIAYEFEILNTGMDYETYIKLEKEKGIPYPDAVFKQTNLIATENGWKCPVCDYKQEYGKEINFMLNEEKRN